MCFLCLLCVGQITILLYYDIQTQTITCISTGGPATTVTWTRDSANVTEGTETVLSGPVTAQYTHTLAVTTAGEYTCTVANNKPSTSSANVTVPGLVKSKFHIIIIICNITGASAPSDVNAVQHGLTNIIVSWSPSISAIGYRIDYNSTSYHIGRVVVYGGFTNRFNLTGLRNGETYTIYIASLSRNLPSISIEKTLTLIQGKLPLGQRSFCWWCV